MKKQKKSLPKQDQEIIRIFCKVVKSFCMATALDVKTVIKMIASNL